MFKKKIIILITILGLFAIGFFIKSLPSNAEYSATVCETVFTDKQEMQDQLDYYNSQVREYQVFLNVCIDDLPVAVCNERWGRILDAYNNCIRNAELVAPIACQRFAEYDFDRKQCACNYGYLPEGDECINSHDYCKKHFGINYSYKADTSSCEINTLISSDGLSRLCMKLHGDQALFKQTDQVCGCYQGYEMIDDQCVKKEQKIIPLSQPQAANNFLNLESGWLIKNLKYVEVFYVDNNLCLRWVVNEKAALKHFGVTWDYEGNIKEFDDLGSHGYKFCDKLE